MFILLNAKAIFYSVVLRLFGAFMQKWSREESVANFTSGYGVAEVGDTDK
jgi:hypothetical protein